MFFYNFLRYPNSSFRFTIKNFSSNEFNVYGFKIVSPKKIDNYYFANLNAKFNSFILEKYEVNEKVLIEKYLDQNDVVLELGGCIGVISNLITRIINNNGAHVVLEIDENKFFDLCDKFRPPHLWKKVNNEWNLRHTVNSDGCDD